MRDFLFKNDRGPGVRRVRVTPPARDFLVRTLNLLLLFALLFFGLAVVAEFLAEPLDLAGGIGSSLKSSRSSTVTVLQSAAVNVPALYQTRSFISTAEPRWSISGSSMPSRPIFPARSVAV